MADHVCHATGCKVGVPPKMFMCVRHWRRLPKGYQVAIWASYRPGQEVTKNPSREYLLAASAAVRYLERIENEATR